ncbi:MAG: phosphate ABC transporter permease subunit PstC [bacterium]
MAVKRTRLTDFLFKNFSAVLAFSVAAFAILIFFILIKESLPAVKKFQLPFLFNSKWDPVQEDFGALTFIWGTLVSSFLALIIAVPISLGTAIFLSELAPSKIRQPLSFLVELLAAIPSVIYGLWGIFVLVPLLRETIQPFFEKYFGFLPFFRGDIYGVGMMAAGIILSIMIIPTISSVSRDIFMAVPHSQREAALALGATRWETIKLAVLKYSRNGVLGAVILGLGRALGETMAVTMLIGNRPEISLSLFAPAATMSSVIANEFTEATSDLYVSTLMEIGLILFVLTLFLNIIARFLVWSTTNKASWQ